MSEIKTLEQVSFEYILKILELFKWNREHAAKALNIPVRNLRHKIVLLKQNGYPVLDNNNVYLTSLRKKKLAKG